MPKDATKNVDRYKIRGGQLNEFDFHQNQEAYAEQQKTQGSTLIPGTPPEARKAIKATKTRKAAKTSKAAKTGKATKTRKATKATNSTKGTKQKKAPTGASPKKLAARKAAKKK